MKKVYNKTISDKIDTTNPKRVRRNRKEEILERATVLIAEHGFQGTTFSQLSEALGLTEPGILHYFPSKIHLLQGVLEYHDKKTLTNIWDCYRLRRKTFQNFSTYWTISLPKMKKFLG